MSKKTKAIYACAVLAVVVLAAIIAADALTSKEMTANFFAMDTTVSLDLVGISSKRDAQRIESKVNELDTHVLSKTASGSQVYALNSALGGAASGELASWLRGLKRLEEASGGAFCTDLGELAKLWDIGGENPRVPTQSEIDRALANSGKWTVNDDSVTIKEGASLDLGAVGKGIACDEARKILMAGSCREAVVAVGGSVLLYSPNGEKAFNVGIRDPRGQASDYAAILELNSCCVSTSGSYERFFTSPDGTRYHHIFNPLNGYPAQSGLQSVTVVSQSGLQSDALSTACFVLGYEKSLQLLEQYGAQAVFITDDNVFYVTDGLRNRIKITADGYRLGEGV